MLDDSIAITSQGFFFLAKVCWLSIACDAIGVVLD